MTRVAELIPDLLIHVDEARAAGGSERALRDACRRGLLVRVRRGSYCDGALWQQLTPAQQHQLAIHAVTRRLRGPFLVAGRSAAAVWGMPFAAGPADEVTLLVPYAGGGTSEPGARRTCVSFDSARAVDVGGIPVTERARTVLDQMRALPFAQAVAAADHVQSRRRPDPVDVAALLDEWSRASFSRGSAAVHRALEFSTPLSDSIGESECRVGIHLAGFEAPQLQRRWHDADGWIETDYFWESVNSAGEFDGRVKYTRDDLTGGDPSAVVWREKRREDRLRRMVAGVVRLVTDEVRSPLVLARILDGAGIPRRSPSLGGRFVVAEGRARGSSAP